MGIEFVGIGHTPVKQVEIHNLCTYPLGIEYAGTTKEVEIEIETKVTPRQESYKNK